MQQFAYTSNEIILKYDIILYMPPKVLAIIIDVKYFHFFFFLLSIFNF